MATELKYRYSDFQDDIGHLKCAIRMSTFKPDLIIGLARGGLIPAVALSHALDVEMESINWPREEKLRSICFHVGDYLQEDKQILIVDDIVDTGYSIKSLLTHLQNGQIEELKTENLRVASLVWYSDSQYYKPDFYGMRICREQYNWVNMIWESKK